MLFEIQPQAKQIPSFESINFMFSEQFITPRNLNITQNFKDYDHGSLTFTETQIGSKQSLTIEDASSNKIENSDVMKITLTKKGTDHFKPQQNSSNPSNIIKMRKKKTILVINSLQFLQKSKTDRPNQTSRVQTKPLIAKKIQRKNSFSTKRDCFVSSQQSKRQQNFRIDQQIFITNHASNNVNLDAHFFTETKQKSISCMKTQDRSIISLISRQNFKPRLQRAISERTCQNKTKKKNKPQFQIKRSESKSSSHRQSSSFDKKEKPPNAKKNFIEDEFLLNQIINVKSIKLELNTDLSRMHLRKIIQNRVSAQHYLQN